MCVCVFVLTLVLRALPGGLLPHCPVAWGIDSCRFALAAKKEALLRNIEYGGGTILKTVPRGSMIFMMESGVREVPEGPICPKGFSAKLDPRTVVTRSGHDKCAE